MIAAVYARKSTAQDAVAAEAKSVARQIDHARAYAERKGWTADDAHTYVDDGISGAEFATRPGFLRLMNALKPKPPFQVLIMSEESRLGREQIEVGYALKQIIQAGVRVFFYLEDRERTLDSPIEKMMLSLTTFADELEREKARQRTTDALMRRARASHVPGGRCFGYQNVPVCDSAGRRDHVERHIKPAEAAIVRRIFTLKAEGMGYTRIAKLLNAERAPAPRAADRSPSWSPSTVRVVLFREAYRGIFVWNKSRKRDKFGIRAVTKRPADEWISAALPDLRIVSDAEWNAAHRRIKVSRIEYDRVTHKQRRPHHDCESKYLLSGFARCHICSGGLHARSYKSGKRRVFTYACTTHYSRGPEACPHVEQWPMVEIDREILATITEQLGPTLADDIVADARRQFEAASHPKRRREAQRALAALDREQRHLTDAIAVSGKAIPALMEKLTETETKRRDLLAVLETDPNREPKWQSLERRIRRLLGDWRSLFQPDDIARARQGLRRLGLAELRFEPFTDEHGYRAIRFTGRWSADAIFGAELVTQVQSPRRALRSPQNATSDAVFGAQLVTKGSSPPGFEPGFQP